MNKKATLLVIGVSVVAVSAVALALAFLASAPRTDNGQVGNGVTDPQAAGPQTAPTPPQVPDSQDSLPLGPTTLPDGRKLMLRMPATHPKSPPGIPLPESLYKDGKWGGQEETDHKILKPLSTGVLLIGGRYIPPPYQLIRVGACQFVNGELMSYAYFWHSEMKAKSLDYVISCLNEELENLWNWLSEDRIVEVSRSYGYPADELWMHNVWSISAEDMSEDTFKWGEMLASSRSVKEKQELSATMGKRRATPFSTGPVCFTKLTKGEIERFQESDTTGFLRQLRSVVDRAIQKRDEQEQQRKEQEKRETEAYDRMMRKQPG